MRPSEGTQEPAEPGHREETGPSRSIEALLYKDRLRPIRAMASALSLLAFALPWIWHDGASSATSGAELMAYTFTGEERADWVRYSFAGALALNVLPWMAFGLAVASTIRCASSGNGAVFHTLTAAMPVLMMLWAGEITSTGHRWGGIVAPGSGMLFLFVVQGALAAAAWSHWWKDREQDRKDDKEEGEDDEGASDGNPDEQ